ncbi:MAG: DUF1156 domain-containing protein [Spiribacter salinus]|uniref:DUF1156 domain-containing protein n=1 Tax=Spiribacter salinus TaxID=1335746 RepID=A0A540VSS8_9GAMM|nr:MAG: DUF1156 domain-containing protein [Spiribacter salinus]
MADVKTYKKLIEVALPLDAINAAAAREKSIRHGHPSTLHLWWARRPLAAARAVIFAQMVNDPAEVIKGDRRTKVWKETVLKERERLFTIISDLVKWENTTNETVLEAAREEIRRSWREVCELNRSHPQAAELFDPNQLPAFHDPFAGGGALPLEAQRLGLEAYASDLNPVAVTINKAMIEIPPKFAGMPPVGPLGDDPRQGKQGSLVAKEWPGASGLAEDVRRYGAWMRAEAEKRIGHLYPKIRVTAEMAKDRPDLEPYVGEELTVIAWLWARTVRSPNPAFSGVEVPLASTFILSSKAGKEAYVQPVIEGSSYRFTVKVGKPPKEAKEGTKAPGRGANFQCLVSGTPIDGNYIKAEGKAGRMGAKLMAVVAEGRRARVYLPPFEEQEEAARSAKPDWRPSGDVPAKLTGGTCVPYGLKQWGDLFTPRQLVALTTFSDLVGEAIERCRSDAITAGLPDDSQGLDQGGTGGLAYAQAVGVYLSFAICRLAMTGNSLVRWNCVGQKAQHCFGRQALPMLWDYTEPNFFGNATGSIGAAVFYSYDPVSLLPTGSGGHAGQENATMQSISHQKVVSTDPPYYDNIAYADLSDFFYVWLRKSQRQSLPSIYSTMAVPKEEELVASQYRHGGKDSAEAFFLHGMKEAIAKVALQAHPVFPITIYYAFKASETSGDNATSSTGWETFLQSVINAELSLHGTWPMRTEMKTRQIAMGTNSLASSVVLVCRKRPTKAPTISRREFIRELNAVLPEALDDMTRGGDHSPVAPVDLSQAIIGPGMAVFSKYSAVLEADGSAMSVKTALQLINRFLAEDDFDADTQFCLHWFEQYGWTDGRFGEADVLARSKGTSVEGVKHAGVISASGGIVRLLKPADYPADWDPASDRRLPVWEALHQMVRTYRAEGEAAAGKLLAAVIDKAEAIRQLAYRLYTLCERASRAEDARAYNELITGWSPIEITANAKVEADSPKQASLFDTI